MYARDKVCLTMYGPNWRNQYDKKDSLELGDKAEVVFRRLAEERGWKLTDATFEENVNEHWGFIMVRNKDNHKIDVKARYN